MTKDLLSRNRNIARILARHAALLEERCMDCGYLDVPRWERFGDLLCFKTMTKKWFPRNWAGGVLLPPGPDFGTGGGSVLADAVRRTWTQLQRMVRYRV